MAATRAIGIPPKGGTYRVLRHSSWDAVLIALSFAYAAFLLSAPSVPLIAIGLWWTANTVAHNFIHTPFFRSRALNRAYSLFLSALMGIPQSLWRDRHLRHHRDPRGFAPRTPLHALSRAASPARSVRVAHSLPLVRGRVL